MIKGIDISYAQKETDFSKLGSDNIEFAILRAGYGKSAQQKDAMFEKHYENAKKNKIKTGAYWYSYAASTDDAKREAEACLEVIRGKAFEFPIAFDIEEASQARLGKAAVSDIINTFCDIVEKQKYYVMVYSYASFLRDNLTDYIPNRYDIWVAHTGVEKPNYPKYGIWQYSHTGKISAINGNVDLNYTEKDYERIIRNAGLNGLDSSHSEPSAPPEPPFRNYTVKKGDSFWAIAESQLGSGKRYMEIVNLNNMKPADTIYPNQILKIPVS